MAFILALIVIIVVAAVKIVCALMRKKRIRKGYTFRVVSIRTEEQKHLADKMWKRVRVVESVKGLISAVIIGAFLALVVFSVFTNRCPSPTQVIAAWEQLARDYESGEITFEASIRRSDRLIECSERWRRRYEQDSL